MNTNQNIRTILSFGLALLLATSGGCASWRINGFRKLIVPPCGANCCHGAPLCFGHYQTCWRSWPKDCGPCPPPQGIVVGSTPHIEPPAPVRREPEYVPPMVPAPVVEPAPIINPAKGDETESLPESQPEQQGLQKNSKKRGGGVASNWLKAVPLGNR